jgi:hypothetical protein
MSYALALLAYLDPGDDGGGLSTLAWIGIVLGALVLSVLAISLTRFLRRKGS